MAVAVRGAAKDQETNRDAPELPGDEEERRALAGMESADGANEETAEDGGEDCSISRLENFMR